VIFMHLVVDFADLWLDGDVRTSTKDESNMFYTKITTTKKWKMDAKVGADVKVSTVGSSMLWNEKSQSQLLNVVQDIHSLTPFASGVSQDPNKEVLRKKVNIFAKDDAHRPCGAEAAVHRRCSRYGTVRIHFPESANADPTKQHAL